MRKSEINFKVELDDNRIPERISWDATENPNEGINETRGISLSVWDHYHKGLLGINLWTKDMPVDEMKIFFHQTLVAMADTFKRATDDEKMSDTMKDFCDYFAEKLELTK